MYEEDEYEEHEIQRRKTLQALSSLTDEQKERLNFFKSQKCKLPLNQVREIMDDNVPPGTKVQHGAAVIASQAAKLFAAELVETARKFSAEIGPLTPDLIYLAYSHMMQHRKIPGVTSGAPLPDKKI